MMNLMLHAVSKLNMSPEMGGNPGSSLSAAQTALYFVVAPVSLFLIISLVVFAFTGEKKVKTEPKDSVLTHIE